MINNTTTMRKKFDSNSKTDKVVVGNPVRKFINFQNYVEITTCLNNSVEITLFLDDTKSIVVLLNGDITPQIILGVPKITTPNLREIEILTKNVKCLVTGPLYSGGNVKITVFSHNFITTLMHSTGSLTTTVVSGGVVSGGKVSGGEVSGGKVSGGSTSEVSDSSTLPPLRQGDPESLRLNAKRAAKRAAACAAARAAACTAECDPEILRLKVKSVATCVADTPLQSTRKGFDSHETRFLDPFDYDSHETKYLNSQLVRYLENWFINIEVNSTESRTENNDMIKFFNYWCSCKYHPVLYNGGICRICAAKPRCR